MKPSERKHTYHSVFASEIRDFIALKKSIGYKYCTEASQLKLFDRLCIAESILNVELTQELVSKWITKKEGESPHTQSSRLSVIREFAKYLNRKGFPVTMPPKIKMNVDNMTFTPYIYTHQQIESIIRTADSLDKPKGSSMFHIIFPTIIRVLYGCGLRVSEALNLKNEDVDLELGTITIKHSKNDNSRKLPVSNSLLVSLKSYHEQVTAAFGVQEYFFPNSKGEMYSQRTVYDKFREVLWLSGISHSKRGPRVHDFRHTFAVHTLQNWIVDGHDSYVLLPILSTYLGHKNVSNTEKYLRLTAEVYPDILLKCSDINSRIIPEVKNS